MKLRTWVMCFAHLRRRVHAQSQSLSACKAPRMLNTHIRERPHVLWLKGLERALASSSSASELLFEAPYRAIARPRRARRRARRGTASSSHREDEQSAWLEGALPARVRLAGSCRVLIRSSTPTSSVILSVLASCCAPAGSVSSSSMERRQFALTCCSLHFSTERRNVDGQVPAGGETGESSIT
jgi:hypothetical protein